MQKTSTIGSVNPSIDFTNPFYCPAVPAATYLKAIRRKLANRKSYRQNPLFNAFANMIDQSNFLDSDAEFTYDPENDWIVGFNLKARRKGRISGQNDPFPPPPYSLEKTSGFTLSEHPETMKSALHPRLGDKRKRNSFSDPQPAPRYAQSILLADESSFEIEVKRERIHFDVTSSPTIPAEIPQENPEPDLISLLERIISILPGIRLRERLGQIPDLTIQKVADFLAENGLITAAVLEVFCTTGVTSLSLAASLAEEDGLNICGQDVLKTFGKAGSFQCLTELSFSGSRVHDFDLIHIHHLPKLSALFLNNTGIGNEAVYLLVPLKLNLTKLSLATNPDVTSESVPALLLLSKLSFLSILDTGVDIAGLRTLAQTVFEEARVIDIEIPYACESYIDNMESLYLLHPRPPLITNPEACTSLTTAALSRNLLAHAERNPAIIAVGTHAEMAERLREILTRRKLDLVVAQMLLGS